MIQKFLIAGTLSTLSDARPDTQCIHYTVAVYSSDSDTHCVVIRAILTFVVFLEEFDDIIL